MERWEKDLEEAETKLREADADEPREPIFDFFGVSPQAKRYETIRALFGRVLAASPRNTRALEGIAACDEMLEPLFPVQLAESPLSVLHPAPPPLPPDAPMWAHRRRARQRQRQRLAATGESFAAEAAGLKARMDKLVRDALGEVQAGRSRAEVVATTTAALQTLQDAADRSWKGHGPALLEPALEQLRAALEGDG